MVVGFNEEFFKTFHNKAVINKYQIWTHRLTALKKEFKIGNYTDKKT